MQIGIRHFSADAIEWFRSAAVGGSSRSALAHPGKSLKYWIESARHGRLGGMSFHAASWHEQVRDAHIGWSPGRGRPIWAWS